jgi:glyoxylase-like metal-dependent hydrolase (beta-lactamase superfamily II)
MEPTLAIPLPLPHVGSVNAWLLRGDPVTLIDTGPRGDAALSALEAGLRREGLRVEDIELLLATHHHLDHVGLAATIQRRSGATVAVLDRTADYAAAYSAEVEADRRFARALMTHHGVPDALVADTDELWDYIRATTEDFAADVRLAHGDRVRAGGRTLRVVARPGHSTTDTIFVDERDAVAFVGDHLLATISSNTEICEPERAQDGRARSRLRYLESLERTRAMPLARLLTGHGAPVGEHRSLVRARVRDHRRRCERILAVLDDGPRTAFEIAGGLWPQRTLTQQTLLVVWEVIGHLELLLTARAVEERVGETGSVFELTAAGRSAPRPAALRRRRRRPVPDCAGGR